jgi:hydrogenase maturation protease
MTTAMSDDQPERADALSPVLVIGYGNDLRSDDGAGRHAAARIDALSIPGVRIVSVHQLAPEISDLLASAKMAIFVDAYPADEGSKIRVEKLASSAPAPGFGHFATPGELLSFAEILYRRQPDAWIVAIPGVSFDFGESLSPTTESGVNDATIIIQELIEQHTQSV